MSVAQMPVMYSSMLMVMADAVIAQNSLTTSAASADRSFELTSAYAERITTIAKSTGFDVDFSSYVGSYTAGSFIYNKATSNNSVYAYYVHLAVDLGVGMDASIYWSADGKKVKALINQTTTDSQYSGDNSKLGIVYDGDAKTTAFVYYSSSTYMAAKVLADSESSSNGTYIGIYDMASSSSDFAETAYADDNGGAATIPCYTYDMSGNLLSSGTISFYFDASGATIDSANSNYETYKTKFAGFDSALSNVDTLAMLTKLSSSVVMPGTGSVVLSGATSVAKGSAYAVSVSGSYSSYAWALDGDDLSDTTSSISIATSDLATGNHSVTAFVTDSSGDEFSASLTFKVTE